MCILSNAAQSLLKIFNEDFPRFKTTKFEDSAFLEVYLNNREIAPDFLKNKFISSEIISKIIDTADNNELWWIATKNCLNQEQVEYLSKHSDSSIRHAIASNKATSVNVLVRLSADEDSYVREAAIERSSKAEGKKMS